MANYSILNILIYGLSLPLIALGKSLLFKQPAAIEKKEVQLPVSSFITSILVPDGNNKKIVIATKDILYFSASSPYISIHHLSHTYLLSETLKSMETQLDYSQFIRIHKSYIVNIYNVVSCQSRLNGDYDVTLTDDTILRVSRNYAALFKARFESGHPLTAK